jgi:hypothetical protein
MDPDKPWIDPGPPPFLGTATDAEFKENLVAVIRASSECTTQDGVTIDISPATIGNNTLGANDGHGYATNPVTGQPYAPNIVLRGDFTRALTEFWADGPSSETPPGHWNSIANHVSDDMPLKRIGGTGPEVDRLEWDVKLYFAINAALHDAGCAAWSVKRYYNAWRPISAIRYCGGLGQSSDPGLASYHASGLPLVSDLIELVTDTSVSSGRHPGLTPGKIALHCWPGQPESPEEETSGVQWVHAEDWMTYQKKTFVTPGFPGYISGHSTFSRAAAEVMTAFTGSKWFPHGLGSYTITRLVNEAGPTQPVTLQWASYLMPPTRWASRAFGAEFTHQLMISLDAVLDGRPAGGRGTSLGSSSMVPSSIPNSASRRAKSMATGSRCVSMRCADSITWFRVPPTWKGLTPPPGAQAKWRWRLPLPARTRWGTLKTSSAYQPRSRPEKRLGATCEAV